MKHIRNFRILALFLILGISAFIWSCQKSDLDLTNINTDIVLNIPVAAPLIYGNLSLEDLLNEFDGDSMVGRYEDSLLYVMFSESLDEVLASEAMEDISAQGFIEEYIEADISLNAEWIASNVGDTVNFHKEKSEEWSFENGERIDSVHIKSLNLVIDVTSSFKHKGILDITSENFTIDGEIFSHEVMISDVSGNFSYTTTIPLDDHWMYLDNSDPLITKIPLNYDLRLINSGNPVLAGENCHIEMTFSDLEFYSAFGYLGEYELNNLESQTIEFDVFDNESIEGEIYLEDPQFILTIDNSMGVPIGVDLSSLSAYSASKGTTINFNLDENPYTIEAPGMDSIGYSKQTKITISNDNSNISEILGSFPSSIEYQVSASTNPDGDLGDNFVTDSSALKASFEAIIPMYLRASGFSLEDTLEFDFQDMFGEESDYIESLELILDVTNSLPMNVDIQLFFVDMDYVVLDSMFTDDEFLIAPSLNSDDEVENPEVYSKSVVIDADKIDRISDAMNILIRAEISTAEATENKSVKFYSYYDIAFKLKMIGDFKVDSDDLE